MFGLIPMVITIILAGLITASVAYFGGDIFTSSSISAKANTLINEGGQVKAAAQLYRTMNRQWPGTDDTGAGDTGTTGVTALATNKKYLSSIPQYGYTINAGSSGFNGDGVIYAYPTNNTGDQAITLEICQKIEHNALGLSDNTDPFGLTINASMPAAEDQLYGCFGTSPNYTFFHR